jgi:Delta7-sterol 5-desaturase|tara:strand:+ start:787 stop:1281 length:495 start_codon:yes stop_codon:yes gene_type:complete
MGWFYLLFGAPALFLMFSDTCVYWIHRLLHHRLFYASIHKLHHKYKETTPFSSYAFHPLDGWLQGCPYHLFVFLFPMHHVSYFMALAAVGLWTINIHDRTTLNLPYVNGSAHHTIHHTGFNYNYGQYFVFWDVLGGSFRDPFKYAPYKTTVTALELSPEDKKLL